MCWVCWFVVGVVVSGMLFPAAAGWAPLLAVLLTCLAIDFLFVVYEVVEGWRIKDWAFRDIGGYLAGRLIVGLAAIFSWGVW